MLDLHAVAHARARPVLLLAHHATLAVPNAHQIGNGCVLELALVLAIVLRVGLVVVVVLLLLFGHVLAVIVRNVVVSLDEALAFTLTTSQVAMELLFTIRQHHNVPLEFSIFVDGFQKLHSQTDRQVSYTWQERVARVG